jgi:hypothetical protein
LLPVIVCFRLQQQEGTQHLPAYLQLPCCPTDFAALLQEFVFDGSSISRDEVIKVEIYNQGTFQDELLFFSYLELHYCASLDDDTHPDQQQQQQLTGDRPGLKPSQQRLKFRPSTGDISEEDEEGSRVGGSSSSQAGEPAAANGVSPRAHGSGSSGNSQSQNGAAPLLSAAGSGDASAADTAGRMSDVTTERLALLCASKLGGSSSGSGRLLSTASELSSRALSGRSGKSLSKMRLKRSTHVRSATDLVVSVWWVQQPALVDTGACWGVVEHGRVVAALGLPSGGELCSRTPCLCHVVLSMLLWLCL